MFAVKKQTYIRSCLLSLLLANSLILARARASSADYDTLSAETQNSAGSVDAGEQSVSALGDAYDAALLQTQLATDKQQNILDSLEEQTESTSQQLDNKNHTYHMNNADVAENMMYENSSEFSQEVETDNLSTTATPATPTTTDNSIFDMPETATTPTTKAIVAEYARKGKKQVFAAVTEDISSDYIEEEPATYHHVHKQYNAPQTETNVQQAVADTMGPYAMKFYESDDEATDSQAVDEQNSMELDNKLFEQQQLPILQHMLQQNFHEPQANRRLIPTAAIGVMPDYQQPILVQAAALSPFLLSFTHAPPNSAAHQITPTSAPIATQATIAATTLAPGTTTNTGAITTLRPAGKQGKQINITTRRKLLPHEQLRNYIEDAYIRMPLAVIVDASPESLEKTKALWREALHTNLNIKIVLIALNESGEPSAFNFNNTRQFLAGLNSVREHPGGNVFIGIMHAAELVPYDSAVFISTGIMPQHTELVHDAAITLLKKRIRLYLMWYGERSASENETQDAVGGILGEVAIRSGGEILHIVGSENAQEIEGSTLTIVADALRGSQELDIPVDTTLSSLQIKIDAPMRTAILETASGVINLNKLVKFKINFLEHRTDEQRLEAYVPLHKLRKSTVYKLKTIPLNTNAEYQVFVRAVRKADMFLENIIRRLEAYESQANHARDSAIKNKDRPTHEHMRFAPKINTEHQAKDEEPKNNIVGPKSEVESFSDEVINRNQGKNGTLSVMADIINVDTGSSRATNLLQVGTTRIEMGVQSQLLITPGTMAQLYFEITNTRSESIYHNIQVTDERSYLQRLIPQTILLRPNEKRVVTLLVLAPSNTAQGVTDRITLTCHGGVGGSISLSVILKVYSQVEARDTTAPTVSWEFGSRCDNVPASSANCAENFWTLDVTAQDWETGILRLQSTPDGLVYRNTYTVGSTEPLKASYVASCCEPKVTLVAYDIAGNQRSYNVDVRDIYLTGAAIAAIVLGVFLLILLIVLIVVLIVWRRRRKMVLDLPTYRSHSTRSLQTT